MDIRIVMIGLDGAGKTSFLYRLKLKEMVTTISTVGFNVETIDYKNLHFFIWDVGGQRQIRTLWNHYFQDTKALIYVIDSHDRDRIDEACEALQETLLKDELKGIPLLILANKQDLSNAMNTTEIADKLKFHSLSDRNWYIQATSTLHSNGLLECLDWLASQLKDVQ